MVQTERYMETLNYNGLACATAALYLHIYLSIYLRNSRAELLELWRLLEILGLWEILGPGQLLEPGYARPLELPKKS